MPAQGVVLIGAISPGWTPTGTTRLVGVLGDPISHSLSPVLHNAAFRELGLDWVYVAMRVEAGQGGAALQAASLLGCAGLSVTMPLKDEVAVAASSVTPTVDRLGVANCLVPGPSGWVAHNTDGTGFVADLERRHGLSPSGLRAFVVGAGGAARAVIDALVQRGASVAVAARRPEAVALALEMVNERSDRASEGRGAAHAAEAGDLERADLVVNATPLGMAGTEGLPTRPSDVPTSALAIDLVYHPLITPWVEQLRAGGVDAHHGVGMLVGQAALQFELWTGIEAPVQTMWDAARRSLGTTH